MTVTDDLATTIRTERSAFGEVLAGLAEPDWDASSLCAGWRVREVVAHMTMPFRYGTLRFLGELARDRGNFARMADRVARRDAREPISALLDGWRTNENSPWTPPGGGLEGALTHDVVHGLDITIPLGIPSTVSERALRVVLAAASAPRSLKHFGADLTGARLQADDLDWSFGDGEPVRGSARSLLMVLCGRRLPSPHLSGPGAARFTTL